MELETFPFPKGPPRSGLAGFLALNRTVAVVLVTVLFFGLGEELWSSFMPAFLAAKVKTLAASALGGGSVPAAALWTVAIYAALRNVFEGFCFIGGGILTARLGDRGSLILFAGSTLLGYLLFLRVPHPWAAVAAAILILGWEPLSVPVTFTTVGSSVDKARQGMAFAVQSIQKRLPKVLGPLIAGAAISLSVSLAGDDKEGARLLAMPFLVAGALVLGAASFAIQFLYMPRRPPVRDSSSLREVLRRFPLPLRRLLVAEIFTRWCDWLVREFVVLYVLFVRREPDWYAGILFGVQHLTALLTYLPIGRMTRTRGLRPFIGLTFIFFALFPLALAWAPAGAGLVLAFVVYGLREIGEPARKAMITNLIPEEIRARGVGLYWGLRTSAIATAPVAGAVLWLAAGPAALLHAAFLCGLLGAVIFYTRVAPGEG